MTGADQLPLFDHPSTSPSPGRRPTGTIVRSAEIDGNYRWTARRAWGAGPCIHWNLLNPSEADALRDDPTMWRMILVLRKRGSLTDRGHGSLSVALADRNGARLADLCTFIENTPTLDQLAGFALWMAAGEERAVLELANVIQITDEGRGHPLLCLRPAPPQHDREWAIAELERMLGPEQAGRVAEIVFSKRKPVERQLSYEQQRARNDAYWAETKGEWIEAMMVFVVGYRNFPIFKQAGAL